MQTINDPYSQTACLWLIVHRPQNGLCHTDNVCDILQSLQCHELRHLAACTAYLPYLTLPPGWTGSYTCPALRPYKLGPMRIPECNRKVTVNGYKAVDGCEAINRWL